MARVSGIAAVKKVIEAVAIVDSESADQEGPKPKPLFDLSRLTLGSDIASGDYQINYLVDKLIPEQAVILFYAKGGSGKSTLATQIAGAVIAGQPFMGLATIKRPVVIIDYENSYRILKKRIQVVAGSEQVYFWPGAKNPPQLNQKEWADMKALVQTLGHPLIIIDTLYSSTSGLDILSNKDYAPVMSKIIELRNLGATIVLLHHTPKGDATQYIGASTIYNQSDHILAMYPVKSPGAEAEVTDEDEAKTYRLGTKDKTRFEPFSMFIEFDVEAGAFALARDPERDTIDRIALIIDRLTPNATQTAIVSAAKEQYLPEKKTRRLLNNHEGREWTMSQGIKNAKIYCLNPAWQFGSPIYEGKTAKQEASPAERFAKQGQTALFNEPETHTGSGLGSLASSVSPGCQPGICDLTGMDFEVVE